MGARYPDFEILPLEGASFSITNTKRKTPLIHKIISVEKMSEMKEIGCDRYHTDRKSTAIGWGLSGKWQNP